ncbi:HET-domain-containing protein [Stipitochalara longipes BDJ]|nr:HET-domain-containing protein [Stipitochalara longipes BDJ]
MAAADYDLVELIPSPTWLPEGPHYISVDSHWINLGQIRGWLARCNTHHGEVCHEVLTTYTNGPSPSITLIDLRQKCLTIPTVPVEYVALSYVWGETPGSLMATTKTLPYLFTPGALATLETSSQIPRTILDAMHLTTEMGVNYLWVDRLCIVQDNIRHFNEQLQQMASIYANTCFTIIATGGRDANHGLSGIGGQSLPRRYEQTYFEFSPEVKVLCEPHEEAHGGLPAWYTRAWTFQERAVSRKTLVVGANTVYWLCRRSWWHEYTTGDALAVIGAQANLERWPFHALTVQRWPDFRQYTNLVSGYNRRVLSFESDALKAFAAILNALGPSFPGGFLFGVPEFLFDLGLLWSVDGPLKLRKDFPSWSWLGWSGGIYFPTIRAWDPEEKSWPYIPSMDMEVLPIIDCTKSGKLMAVTFG